MKKDKDILVVGGIMIGITISMIAIMLFNIINTENSEKQINYLDISNSFTTNTTIVDNVITLSLNVTNNSACDFVFEEYKYILTNDEDNYVVFENNTYYELHYEDKNYHEIMVYACDMNNTLDKFNKLSLNYSFINIDFVPRGNMDLRFRNITDNSRYHYLVKI